MTREAVTAESRSPEVTPLRRLNRPQQAISRRVVQTANWIDRFFGEDRSYQESQGSYLRVSLGYIREIHGEGLYDFNVRGNLNLPRTEERLKLILESDPDEEEHDQLYETLEAQTETLGLRYTPLDNERWRFHSGVGVRFNAGLDAFVRVRLRGQFPGEIWSTRFSQTIAHFESTGVETVSRVDFERELGPRSFLRAASIADWTEERDYFVWNQRLSLFHNLDQFRVLRYRIGTRSITRPSLHAVEHYLSIDYRKQLHGEWLFMEVSPQLSFRRERDFAPVRSILIRFDAIFGEPKRN